MEMLLNGIKYSKVDIDNVDSKDAKKLYNQLYSTVMPKMAQAAFNRGYSAFSSGRFEEALKELKQAVSYDKDNADALYYLARTYQRMAKNDKAKETFEKVMTDFPDSRRCRQAEEHMQELS